MTREYDVTYIYADEMPKLKALLTQSVEGRQWVSTSIDNGRERWKFCRFKIPSKLHQNHFGTYKTSKLPYAGKNDKGK